MKMLMVLAVSILSTSAFAIELSPSNPDIMTPNCEAHAFFAPNTNIVIIDIPAGKCDSFRTSGSDLWASESRLTKDGLRVSIEGKGSGTRVSATVMNIDNYPFRKDEIQVSF